MLTNGDSDTLISEEVSDEMKKLLEDKQSKVGSVIFCCPFDRAPTVYKAVWKWLVMEILPTINFRWKGRVNAGAHGKANGEPFFSIVTASDLAFAYTLLAWGAEHWSKREQVPGYVDVVAGAEDHEVGVNSIGSASATSRSSGEAESKKRGRKKGEKGFASQENIRAYNANGEAVEKSLFEPSNRVNVKRWVERAMMWVNGEVAEDEEGGDECGVYKKRKSDNVVVPFMPRDLSDLVDLVPV
jgi:hypothetical protein